MKDLQYPLIIDTDAGADDLIALMLALHSSELFPDALLTSYGSFPEDEVLARLQTILHHVQKSHIPIFRGSSFPLEREYIPYYGVHGTDSLSIQLATKTASREITEIPDTLKESSYIYLGLGPLTNLATLLKTSFASRIKKAIIFGGTLSFPGNVTPKAEANFWWDPEAVREVFLSGIPIELVTLDVSKEIQLENKKISTLKNNTLVQNFFLPYEQFYVHKKKNYKDLVSHLAIPYKGGVLHDPLVLFSLCDGIVTFSKKTIVLDSVCTERGYIYEDLELRHGNVTATVDIATGINATKFWRKFNELLK